MLVSADKPDGSVKSESAAPESAAWPAPRAAWYAVCMIGLVSVLSNIDRGIVAVLVQPLKRDLALSDTQVSLLIGAAFSLPYMLLGLPMSRVADVRSRKVILTVGLSIWSLATSLTALASGFLSLFIARGVVGGAESVKTPCSLSLISDLVPRQKLPRAMSIYSMGVTGGQAASIIIGGLLLAAIAGITPLHVPLLGELKDWQIVFLACGLPGLLVASIFYFTVAEPSRKGRRVKGSLPVADVGRFLWLNRRVYLPLFLSLIVFGIDQSSFNAWRIAFYERTYGWGPGISGPVLGTVSLAAAPVGLLIGTFVAEHFDRRARPDAMLRLLLISNSIAVPAAVAGLLMPNPWLAVACGAVASVANAMGLPGQNAAMQIITPNEMRGQVSALYLLLYSVIGGGIGVTLVALITDFIFMDEAMLRYSLALTSSVLGPIGIYLTWRTLRPYGELVTRTPER